MPGSPEHKATIQQSEFGTAIGGTVHQWAPHGSLGIYSCSIIIFLAATLWAVVRKRRRPGRKPMTGADLLRVGFAAGPIPIYLLLPLTPFDPDLSAVILDEPFQLLIAAGIGLVWTYADIKKIVGR